MTVSRLGSNYAARVGVAPECRHVDADKANQTHENNSLVLCQIDPFPLSLNSISLRFDLFLNDPFKFE